MRQRFAGLGLSPRMRGNLWRVWANLKLTRSIPAYAGEPTRRRRLRQRDVVYPRVCGGTLAIGIYGAPALGLSPRMRGNRRHTLASAMGYGSIPAYAGEPVAGYRVVKQPQVYPRVCGGTALFPSQARYDKGLSPRMRGNRLLP